MQRLFPLLLALLSTLAMAQEEVYRWKDARGHTHYGNAPPADVEAEPIGRLTQPVTVNAGEQVYTWKDAQGNVYYGDRPPSNGQAEQMDTNSSSLTTIRATEVRPGEQQLLNDLQR